MTQLNMLDYHGVTGVTTDGVSSMIGSMNGLVS